MKQFLCAAALVAASASVGFADDKPAASAAATPATPVVVAGTPVVEYAPAAPARRGLFSRLRNRNTGTTTYSTPVTTTTVSPTSTTPMPAVAPPQAMPNVKPSGAMVPPSAPGVIVVGGTVDTGTVTTAGYTEPMPAPARRGLFSRLRNR